MSEEIIEEGTQEVGLEEGNKIETTLEGTEEEGNENGDSEGSEFTDSTGDNNSGDISTGNANATSKYDPAEEISELRQFLREQKREIATLKAKGDRLEQQGQEVTTDENDYEEEEKEKTPVQLSIIENLQEEIHTIGQERAGSLDIMVDAMAETQKYNDIKQICTRQNFDDIFEMIAGEIVNKEGGNFDEVILGVEAEVWRMSNPYKYMHGLIKEYHPKFTATETAAKTRTPVDAPPSVVGMGGSGGSTSGWTAAKIDSMPEDLLHTVPKEVYNSYMAGKLK